MFYVLFNYTKGKKKHERSFETCSSEKEVIDLLHEHYKEIEVYRIIETARNYRLGLVVTEELVKSVLEPEVEVLRNPHPLLKDRKPEKSAMEKIGDDIEEEQKEELTTAQDLTDAEILAQNKKALGDMAEGELTPEEKTEAAMDKADRLIVAEKQKLDPKKKAWELCPDCKIVKVAPWNSKGICSICQRPKGTRKYKKRKTSKE